MIADNLPLLKVPRSIGACADIVAQRTTEHASSSVGMQPGRVPPGGTLKHSTQSG